MNYGYQPMYPYQAPYTIPSYRQPQYAQPTAQQMSQQAPSFETPIQDVRFATAEEAKAYIVMPNGKALLIDRQGGMAHLKIADNMGQSVTQYFKFERVNADGTPIKPKEQAPAVDFGQFVRKEDLATLGFVTIDEYASLLNEFKQLKEYLQRGRANGTKPNPNPNPQQ